MQPGVGVWIAEGLRRAARRLTTVSGAGARAAGQIAVDGFGGKESTRTEVVKPNQVRPELEVRKIQAAAAERKLAGENHVAKTKEQAETAVSYINSALGDTFARVAPTTAYGTTFPVTSYHVNISALGADRLATLLNDNGLCPS